MGYGRCNRLLLGLIATVGLMLACSDWGCTVGPDYQPPQKQLPDSYSNADPQTTTTQPADTTEWWTLFGDPTLNSLIERAIQSNLDLRMAAARVRQARAERGMIAADLWPQVNLVGSYVSKGESRYEKPLRSGDSTGKSLRDSLTNELVDSGMAGAFDSRDIAAKTAGDVISDKLTGKGKPRQDVRSWNLFEAGFDASWEIDVFGRVRRSVEAADAEIQATQEEYRDLLLTMLFEVARNYVEARGYQSRLAIAEKNVQIQQRTLEMTQTQYEGGLTSELDVLRAKAQLASTRSTVATLRSSFRQAVHQLSLLLGEFPNATLAEMSHEQPIPSPPPQIPVALPSELLRRRPDVRQCERQLAAATARIGVATAELFPQFSLTGTLTSEAYDARRLMSDKSLAWSVGPSFSWPIFDAGRIRAQIDASNAVQQEILAAYERTVLQAITEVEDALIAYQDELSRHQDLADAVDANRLAVSMANSQYNDGVTDFLDLVDAERSLYSSEDQLVRSRVDTTLHAIAVFKALGGGWENVAAHEPECPTP